MAFCLAYVTQEDFFIDCGANVGVYSILLGSECAGGIALEPGSDTFAILEENLRINNLTNVQALKSGAGARKEQMLLTKGNDTTNHVIHKDQDNSFQDLYETIEIVPLDSFGSEETTILKIDVEGMEKSVLEGAHNLLMSDVLNVVILETFGSGDLHESMINYGFHLCSYNPENRELIACGENDVVNNGIYVKNVMLAQKRLKKKKRYEILGVSI